eukprot:13883636-Ditylum_brightwellii.AAC.1
MDAAAAATATAGAPAPPDPPALAPPAPQVAFLMPNQITAIAAAAIAVTPAFAAPVERSIENLVTELINSSTNVGRELYNKATKTTPLDKRLDTVVKNAKKIYDMLEN